MNSDEKILFAVAALMMLSLPAYLTIHLYNREVVPNLVKFGWTIGTVDQVVHIVVFSLIAGFAVEWLIAGIIDYILRNL